MTHHEEADQAQAFAAFRESIEPLELSGKLRGILLQYHPRFVKSDEAKDELSKVRALLDPLVPLIEFRHRSWLLDDERDDTLSFLERHGLAVVSVDAPPTKATNVLPTFAAATHPVAYVRFHGRNVKTWNIKSEKSWQRFDWMYSAEELQEWVEPFGQLSEEADEVYALFNNNRDDFAPRSAMILRGLLDEAGYPLQAASSLPPNARRSSDWRSDHHAREPRALHTNSAPETARRHGRVFGNDPGVSGSAARGQCRRRVPAEDHRHHRADSNA